MVFCKESKTLNSQYLGPKTMKYNMYKLWKGCFCGSRSSTYCLEQTFMLTLDHPRAHNNLDTGQKMQGHLLRDCLEQFRITYGVSYVLELLVA